MYICKTERENMYVLVFKLSLSKLPKRNRSHKNILATVHRDMAKRNINAKNTMKVGFKKDKQA